MGLPTTAGGGQKTQRPIPPAGTHAAILYSIVDIGTHMKTFQGQEPKATPLVIFSWEFPNLPKQIFAEGQEPKPLSIMQEYTASAGEKAKLYKVLLGWRGVPPVNLAQELPLFLGQPCMLNVVHAPDKTTPNIMYANIALNGLSVMRPMEGMAIAPITNPKKFFDLNNFSWAEFHSLNQYFQNKIKVSLEWSGILAKFGPEPVNPNAGTSGQQQQSFAQMSNVNQPVQQQFQQPVQQMQQAPSFANPVQNVQAPQFHSGHNPNLPPSGANAQQFAPQVQETGIIIDNGTPPSF